MGEAHDYGVRGCGSHAVLPRKGFLQSLWFPFHRRRIQYRHCLLPNLMGKINDLQVYKFLLVCGSVQVVRP